MNDTALLHVWGYITFRSEANSCVGLEGDALTLDMKICNSSKIKKFFYKKI